MQELLEENCNLEIEQHPNEFENIAALLGEVNSSYKCRYTQIEIQFKGKIQGVAFFVIGEPASCSLVEALCSIAGLPAELQSEAGDEMLGELGNVALNACVGSLADKIGDELLTCVPCVFKGPTTYSTLQKYSKQQDSELLYSSAKISFPKKADSSSTGHIGLVLEKNSLDKLITYLNH